MDNKLKGFAISVIALMGLFVVISCSSATWDDARQADTYEAYQAYINDNPEGSHIKEAQTRADSSYWRSIRNDTTAGAFETYLNKFPAGRFRSEAQVQVNRLSPVSSEGRITGSNIIIRSDHTTAASSAGVIAKEGTVVQILDRYSSGNSNEAILKNNVTVVTHGKKIALPKGKSVRITADRNDSVEASFSTSAYGATEAMISKKDIEAMSGQIWYKIHTRDDITGWVYGKFVEEL